MIIKSSFTENLKAIFSKNLKKLFILSGIVVFAEFIIGGVVLYGYSNYIKHQLKNNIVEYNEIDLQQLCNIAVCKKVVTPDYTFKPDEHKILRVTSKTKHNFIIGGKNTSLDFNLNFWVYNKKADAYFKLDTSNLEAIIFKTALTITPFLIFMLIIFLYYSIKEERELSLRALAGNEALLSNKSMILITENIHHELNTPLDVIDSKLYKIKKITKKYIDELPETHKRKIDKKLLSIDNDFYLITQSLEQINAVLRRMKGFKNIKYSNGNKSVHNIIEGAFKVISMRNSNFESKISPELKRYSIDSGNFRNADLLNIVLNHIKNSLEANSTKIYVIYKGSLDGKIKINISDNGNGIKSKSQKSIFNPNFSTKNIDKNGVRGNGLYLNKFILNSGGGDVKLIETSKYGTTFELTFRVVQRKETHPEDLEDLDNPGNI